MATMEKYEWSGGLPVIVYSDVFEWSGGLPFIIYQLPSEIIKIFEDSGSGVEGLLVDKILIIVETGSGVDVYSLVIVLKTFSDSGSGAETILTNKILIIPDSGSGVESWVADKLREFADSGVGVDVFLKNWTPIFTDLGSGVEAYYKVFPYPPNLKRIIILIRDKK